ncbi:putative pyridoxal phosphate-dependent aminotransferase EpsN [Paenibacillus silvae]|uniref:Pyridoxal phosphate-dependent aminotransferase EpsN n=1 Tax=Paenibacillus silvae TaxID=1325358 RepID=A0ABQ1ZIS0_9BACL|nr:aminotransferase class I/II-fold pyridoxal phosphate-dependent enzyme [Paenibacillus silvae]GGH64378.1 putative pyridoxal phosphate-dependent aminotransferase EpsN [Paenibacillus silvae]
MKHKRIFLASPHMSGKEQKYINDAFVTNWVAPLGPNVDAFEKEVAKYAGSTAAVALSSGTSAIHLALELLEVQAEDLVFCSSLTFAASANPILYQKAIPVFIDSEPTSWNMSPIALERALKDYAAKGRIPKAVIVVNLYGQSADYDPIKQVCDAYEVPIIEDAAESLGATYKGRMSGSIGKFGVFSFNGNKIITTSGGGMLISDDIESLNKARFLATQARDEALHYQHSQVGYNYRLSNVLAGIGRGQMEVLEDRVIRKREIREYYHRELASVPGVTILDEQAYGRSTHWLTTMLLDPKQVGIEPVEIIKVLEENNIEARPIWKPMHLQPLFKQYSYYSHAEDEDISANIFAQGLCLPSGTNMSDLEIDEISNIVKKLISV